MGSVMNSYEKEVRKKAIREWMARSSQIFKADYSHSSAEDIAKVWQRTFGIKMTAEWIKKACAFEWTKKN